MEVTTSEIQDAITEPKTVRLHKDQKAPFDGALIPFNDLSSFYKKAKDYDALREDYFKNGIITDDTEAIRTVGSYVIVFSAALLLGSAITTPDNRDSLLIISSVAMATGITLVVF